MSIYNEFSLSVSLLSRNVYILQLSLLYREKRVSKEKLCKVVCLFCHCVETSAEELCFSDRKISSCPRHLCPGLYGKVHRVTAISIWFQTALSLVSSWVLGERAEERQCRHQESRLKLSPRAVGEDRVG